MAAPGMLMPYRPHPFSCACPSYLTFDVFRSYVSFRRPGVSCGSWLPDVILPHGLPVSSDSDNVCQIGLRKGKRTAVITPTITYFFLSIMTGTAGPVLGPYVTVWVCVRRDILWIHNFVSSPFVHLLASIKGTFPASCHFKNSSLFTKISCFTRLICDVTSRLPSFCMHWLLIFKWSALGFHPPFHCHCTSTFDWPDFAFSASFQLGK